MSELFDSNVKISVILPNYNGAGSIEKSIKSFLNQDYENKELIIVDGKSTDASHQIIENYCNNFPLIKWIKEIDINVTDAINIGIKYAEGDFVSFLASDVFYYESDIFSFINKRYAQVPFDAIYFDYYCYYPTQGNIYLLKCPNIPFTKNNLLSYGTIVGFDNIFISKNIYKKHTYNPKYNLCSDWEFFLRISQEKLLFLYVEKICTINVQNGNNLSMKFQELQKQQILEVASLYNSDNIILYFNKYLPQKQTFYHKIKQVIKRILIR